MKAGDEFSGNVIWSDSDIDLSIVKIDARRLTPVTLGNSDNIRIGNSVYAIGNPIGMDFARTVTSGIISAVDRTIKLKEDGNLSYMEDLIQTDATINNGNSGGPLINENGEVIRNKFSKDRRSRRHWFCNTYKYNKANNSETYNYRGL